MKHTYSLFRRKSLRTVLTVAGSMSVAFVIGIQTAGEFQPVVSPTMADANVLAGDLNGNGQIDQEDVRIALEIAGGYRSPTPSELAADPNRDFRITADDAMTILDQLKYQPQATNVDL